MRGGTPKGSLVLFDISSAEVMREEEMHVEAMEEIEDETEDEIVAVDRINMSSGEFIRACFIVNKTFNRRD